MKSKVIKTSKLEVVDFTILQHNAELVYRFDRDTIGRCRWEIGVYVFSGQYYICTLHYKPNPYKTIEDKAYKITKEQAKSFYNEVESEVWEHYPDRLK
jgi:hypothetical protein